MRRVRRISIPILAAAALWAAATMQPAHGQGARPQRVAAGSASTAAGTSDSAALAALQSWNNTLVTMTNAGQLRSTRRDSDALVAGRWHERLAQYYRGVRVFGGQMVRQTNFVGQVVSIFGAYYPDIAIDVTPAINSSSIASNLASRGLGSPRRGSAPELVVLPMDDGSYRLTWYARVANGTAARRVFVDATTGDVVFSTPDRWTAGLPGAVGSGTGVIGDLLKVQSQSSGGTFLAVDLNRGPGQDTTYDMKGNFARTNLFAFGPSVPVQSDIAIDTDNRWNDPAVVSSQAYAGYTYDYFRQTYGRNGLDGHNIKIRCFVNVARPQDALNPPPGSDDSYYNNAFYDGDGYIFFGVGQITGGQVITRNWAGALDVVAHELTHGVTDFTSQLDCCNEPGALNESFSDMMGIAVEFKFQALGSGPGKADWLLGEDVFPSGGVIRNPSNPHSVVHTNGPDPDHYSLKQTASVPSDSNDLGWVHANSNIVTHMYYLAIMGGVNRVSGLSVQGVGFANRALIERAVYRAFTVLMPSNSTFSTCRLATIQAARDLYGNGSAAETALTQAWNAVGVS